MYKSYDLTKYEDVLEIYNIYLKVQSIRQLEKTLGLSRTKISSAFHKFNFRVLNNVEARKATAIPPKVKPKKDRVQTCLNKYGVANPRQYPAFNKQIIEKRTKHYLARLQKKLDIAECIMLEPFTRVQDKNGKYIQYKMQHKCGYIFTTTLRRDIKCPHCYHINRFSKYEIHFKDYLAQYIDNLQYNKKFGLIYELDIFIPDKNIGIEFNGTYWHTLNKKGLNYHSLKTDYFTNLGIKVYHFWDYQSNDYVEDFLSRLLGLPNIEQIYSNSLSIDIRNDNKFVLCNQDREYISVDFQIISNYMYLDNYYHTIGTEVIGGNSMLINYILNYARNKQCIGVIASSKKDITPVYTDSEYFKHGFSYMGYTSDIKQYNIKEHTFTINRSINKNVFSIQDSGTWWFKKLL